MAIITEFFKTRNDGVDLYRTYSDLGLQILQVETNTVYDDAIDVKGAPYTYIEYEEPTDDPEDIAPEISEGENDSAVMTRAELTAEVTEIREALDLILSGVTE